MGKGQQQRPSFGFGIVEPAHKQQRAELKLPHLLLHCPDLCAATVLCYPFPDCPRLYKRNNGAAKCMRKDDISLLCLYICELWIAVFFPHFEYPWWRKALSILVCSRLRWPSYCSSVCVSLPRGLGFSLARLFSAVNLVIERGGIAMPDTWQKARLEGEEWGQPLT